MFGVGKYCSLRGKGRRDWEVGLWRRIRMKHIITFESIEFSFFRHIHIILAIKITLVAFFFYQNKNMLNNDIPYPEDFYFLL